MADKLTIAFAQMNQRVGDLDGNAQAMLEMRQRAKGADLLMCPELQLTGYPPEDLVLKPEFVRRTHECTDRLVAATTEPGPALLIGTLIAEGSAVYNAFVLAQDGKVIGRTLKHELPNYGTFDEKRVFAPGPLHAPIEFRGVMLGVSICEDYWFDDELFGKKLSRRNPVDELVRQGAKILALPVQQVEHAVLQLVEPPLFPDVLQQREVRAPIGIGYDQLAVEFKLKPEHAVRGRMLRAERQRHLRLERLVHQLKLAGNVVYCSAHQFMLYGSNPRSG